MTSLELACAYGSLDVVGLLINKLQPDTLKSYYTTTNNLFHLISHIKQDPDHKILPLIQILYAKLPSPDNVNLLSAKDPRNQQNLLHLAILNNHIELVSWLVNNSECFHMLNEPSSTNASPIHLVAKMGSIESFEVFEKANNIDLTILDSNANNLLHIATEAGHYEFIENLLNGGCSQSNVRLELMRQRNNEQMTPIELAILLGRLDIANVMKKHVDICILRFEYGLARDGSSLFHACVRENRLVSVGYLFSFLEEIYSERGGRRRCINVDMMMMMKKLIFSTNETSENSVFHLAALNSNVEMIGYFIEQCEFVMGEILFYKNREELTCFHICCIKGNF